MIKHHSHSYTNAQMKTPQQRKNESIQNLKQNLIPHIDHLPVIESVEEAQMRTAEEIAKRAIACLWVIQVACDLNNDQYDDETQEFVFDILKKDASFGRIDRKRKGDFKS